MAQSFEDDVLLERVLEIHPQTDRYVVVVTRLQITCTLQESAQDASRRKMQVTAIIKFADVLGCDCMRGKSIDSNFAYLNIYTYGHHKKMMGKDTLRKRKVTTLVFKDGSSFGENQEEASRWQLVMTYLIRKVKIQSGQDIQTLAPLPVRQFMVLVNPFSGPGKALHVFQQHVVPMFAEAGQPYTVSVTEYAGHAKDIVKNMKLDDWYGIVIVSGDGLVFEVINGLMERPDWELAIKKPIGALPGGSGNALASSLAYQIGEPYLEKHILHATFGLCKHTVVPMDLVAVETCTGKKLFSFLSVAWGIISDVDIESERFRNMGNARFTLGAVIRIADLRKYRGRISYLPVDKSLTRTTSYQEESASNSQSKHPERLDRSVSLYNQAGTAADTSAPDDSREPSSASSQPSTSVLPPLSSPVPANWITVEDDFILVVAVYLTHLAQDSIAAPESRLADGTIFLAFTRATVSRIRLLKLFTAMSEGKPINDPSTQIVRARAFRLEPLGGPNGNLGRMTVDGELVDCGPIQGEVLPSMARIMTLVKE